MRTRDVKRLKHHRLTNGGHLRGWLAWPLVIVEHGLFFTASLVWTAKHHPCCATRDDVT